MMSKIKGVLIDVGKTIVTNRVLSFKNGLKAIYEISDKAISFDQFYQIHLKLHEITFAYLRRFNNEMRLTDYLIALNNLCNIKIERPIEEIEDIFQKNMVEEELIDGIVDLLEFFSSANIPVIAVSNSCISGRALSVEFAELGILKYFKKIISSADIYICKPRKEIFEYAIGQLKKITKDATIANDEIIFIGNDYNCDCIGAKNVGLKAIWFNQTNSVDTYNICDLIINSYSQLLDNLEP